LKEINNWNNKKKKVMNTLMNLLKIYMKIISIINKYLKQLLILNKKNFKNINNNLINNTLKMQLIKKNSNKL